MHALFEALCAAPKYVGAYARPHRSRTTQVQNMRKVLQAVLELDSASQSPPLEGAAKG